MYISLAVLGVLGWVGDLWIYSYSYISHSTTLRVDNRSLLIKIDFPHISKAQSKQPPTRASSTPSTMAATQKLYPRGTVKRIVKAHSNRSVSKNADILVCLRHSLPQRVLRYRSLVANC